MYAVLELGQWVTRKNSMPKAMTVNIFFLNVAFVELIAVLPDDQKSGLKVFL